ncbi:MAG: hemolysin family protein [Halosimplex sp.]
MADLALSAGRLLLALVLVSLNGFFVAAEFALVRVRPTQVDALVDDGHRFAPLLAEELDSLDDYLAVSQLGITIASLGLGWVGEPAVAELIRPLLATVLPEAGIHAVAVAIGFGIITFLHVVYGELAPKTLAIQEAERIALIVALPMRLLYYVFVPGIVLFNGTANLSTRLVGIEPASETDETHTEEEILAMLSESGEAGSVDTEEVEMIERVFDLDDTTVREIMRPRPDVESVPADTPLPELRSMAAETEYTRYPVVESTGEDVTGFVDVKDILRTSESIDDDADGITAGDLARDVVIVPETITVDELLSQFKSEQRQMAAVVNEWGAFEGLVTVEDVVEEVVGDIRDQFDLRESEPTIEPLEDGGYVVDGDVPVDAVNEALGADFDEAGVETIGGFVLGRLGRAPEPGDTVDVEGYRMTVDEVSGARVLSVRIAPVEPDEDGAEPDEGDAELDEGDAELDEGDAELDERERASENPDAGR